MTTSVHTFDAIDINGENHSLKEYEGDVLLIVNVASKCGLTPQYEGLEKLHEEFSDSGLRILGFPCNQFLGQEPGDEAQIKEFCTLNYGVKFPMFGKIEVNGDDAHPLYKHMKSKAPGVMGTEAIKWNFTKFLVDREGQVVRRYAPKTTPEDIRDDIAEQLQRA